VTFSLCSSKLCTGRKESLLATLPCLIHSEAMAWFASDDIQLIMLLFRLYGLRHVFA